MSPFFKSGFWTSCMLVLISTVSTWWWSTTKANRNRQSNEFEILAAIRDNNLIFQQSFSGAPRDIKVHPSPGSNRILRDRLNQVSRELLNNWKTRRSTQDQLFRWPAAVNRVDELARAIGCFEPTQDYSVAIERRGQLAPELPNLMLIYGRKIPAHFLEMTRARQLRLESANAPANKAELSAFAVRSGLAWTQSNREFWSKKLREFASVDGNASSENIPLPRQAFALQEDLWLFEAFLQIVEQQNQNASPDQRQVVKSIEHVYFGREAWTERDSRLSGPNPQLFAQRLRDNSRGAQEVRDDFEDFPSVDSRPSQLATNHFNSEIDGPNAVLAPFHGRYVNTDFQPQTIQDWSIVGDTQVLPNANVESVVCRRVPFRIALLISEQSLPRFIHAMQSNELGFNIWQLRINRDSEYSGPGYSPILKNLASNSNNNRPTVDVPGSGKGSMVDGESSTDAASNTTGKTGKANRESAEVRQADEVHVEITGMVRIVNPINLELIRRATMPTVNEHTVVGNLRRFASH